MSSRRGAMIAASLNSRLVVSEVVIVASFPSKLGRPKQKEAARQGHPRAIAENDFAVK
jgi:hypothetical protein